MPLDASVIRAAVFDLGGTLLDFAVPESLQNIRAGLRSGYDHLAAQGRTLPEFHVYRRTMERRLLWTYLTARLRRAELDTMAEMRGAHARLGLALDGPELAELARRIYAPTKALVHVRADAVAAIAELRRRGYLLGLISNTVSPPPGLDDHLADEGLLDLLPVRVYSCDVGVPKPHPRIFRVALDRLGVAPDQAVYVGDKPFIDVKGARRVGMPVVLRVRRGRSAPRGPQPDLVIHEIADLLEVLPPLRRP